MLYNNHTGGDCHVQIYTTADSIGDMASIIERNRKRKKMLACMLLVGLIMDIIEISTLVLGIVRGVWLPFGIGMAVCVLLGMAISVFYYRHTEYICPECHGIFKVPFNKCIFAFHKPRLRKLTCTNCGRHGFCVEIYGGKNA